MAAVLYQADQPLAIEPVELDALGPNEILVRNEACGICHTDLIAADMVPLPGVFGHEGVGIVEAVGASVTKVAPGMRVIASYPQCAVCSNCLDGKPYYCSHHMTLGFSGKRLDGSPTIFRDKQPISGAFFQQSSFATHSIVAEQNIIPAHDGMPSEILAAVPCGVQTGAGAVLNTFKPRAGDSLAVFGVGTVGLSAIMAGRLLSAFPLIAIDVNNTKLQLARELGATHLINAAEGDTTRQLREICPAGLNFTLETSANEAALESAIACLASGGTCGMVIAPNMGRKYPFSPSEIFRRAAVLQGIIQGSSVPQVFIPRLLELQRRGLFPFERLITKYPFEDINKAIQDVRKGSVVKPVLTFN